METKLKSLKVAHQVMIYVNIILSMLYVAGIDSLSNTCVILYGAILVGLWYIVKLIHDEIEITE